MSKQAGKQVSDRPTDRPTDRPSNITNECTSGQLKAGWGGIGWGEEAHHRLSNFLRVLLSSKQSSSQLKGKKQRTLSMKKDEWCQFSRVMHHWNPNRKRARSVYRSMKRLESVSRLQNPKLFLVVWEGGMTWCKHDLKHPHRSQVWKVFEVHVVSTWISVEAVSRVKDR